MVSFVYFFSFLICHSGNVKMFAILWFRNCCICSSNVSTGYTDRCIAYELLLNAYIEKYYFQLDFFAVRTKIKVAFAFFISLLYICNFSVLSK